MAITIKNVVGGSNNASVMTTNSIGSVSIGDLVVVMYGYGSAGAAGSSVADNAGNTYTKITARNSGNSGFAINYSFLTVANSALTVTVDERGTSGATVISVIVWWITGLSAYNNDQANNANFSGTSTAWTVGPTSVTPPAGSIFFYALSADNSEPSTPEVTGYNTVGSNGFTSGMQTQSRIETNSASSVVLITGYKISSARETPATTLPNASIWTGGVASFSPTGGGGGGGKVDNIVANIPGSLPMIIGPNQQNQFIIS